MGLFGGISTAVGERTEKTVIAKETRIKGDIQTDALLLIDGEVEGEIQSASEVSIGANGKFSGTLRTRRLIVNGSLKGTVHCDKLEILKSGVVQGDVNLKDFTIEPGGRFYGVSREAGEPEIACEPKLLSSPQEMAV